MKTSTYHRFWLSTLYARKRIGKIVSGILLYSGLLTLVVLVYDAGFDHSLKDEAYLFSYYAAIEKILIGCFVVRNGLNIFNPDKKISVKILDAIILSMLLLVMVFLVKGTTLPDVLQFLPSYKYVISPLLIGIFVIEFSRNAVSYYTRRINPALIFLMSFFLMIAIGTGLLLLPHATTTKITLVDALFTSTSAICVTGLIVHDTATVYTGLGKFIIMVLIQIGGLGIMTFAGFIGHMFSGGASFQQRFLLGEFSNADKVGEVMKTIYKIILITLTVEVVGAVLIYTTLTPEHYSSEFERVFFSVFHSISAFCNAGFSTLSLGLYDIQYRFNYPFLIIISLLLTFGGLGFPIVLNFYNYSKVQLLNVIAFLFKGKRFKHVPYVLNFSSKLIFISTISLILIGWIGFFIFEYNGVLREHGLMGKLATSFLGSTTPRTAGFNSVDMTQMLFPTVMMYILLMYIGASPGGTGGGIKTTTFSVMIINFWNVAAGKDKLIAMGREIKNATINRAFSIVSLSLIVLGVSVALIYSFETDLELLDIVFEAFSAFSTVGLSLGITPGLSDKSKVVLILVMFIGRVGTLTFLSAFIFKKTKELMRFPKEEVIF